MAWSVPSLRELIDRITGDLVARAEDKTALVRHSLPWILARVLAAAVSDLYQWAGYLAGQVIPLTATGDWLDAWAQVFGLARRAAEKAWGNIVATGSPGSSIPAGTVLTDGLGHEWEVEQTITLSGTSAKVPVSARIAGSDGNVSGGSALTFVSPPTGVESTATVLETDGITGGTGAAKARGYVRITGEAGAILPAGTVIKRFDGAQFTTDANVTWPGDGDLAVAVTAAEKGTSYNTSPLTPMDIVSPPLGITSRCYVVADGIYGGTDEETDTSLRNRLLQRLRNPPHGGSLADYATWAGEVEGVTVEHAYAFAYPDLALGLVRVYFTVTATDPIPTAAQIAAVQEYLQSKAPAGIEVAALAPAKHTVNVTITGLTVQAGYSLTDVQAAIEAALRTLLRGFRVRKDVGIVYLSQLHAAIAGVEGVDHYNLTAPAADISVPAYTLPVLGTITWA